MAKTEQVTVEQLQRRVKMLEKKLKSAESELWFVRSERDSVASELVEERKFKQLFVQLVQLAAPASSTSVFTEDDLI